MTPLGVLAALAGVGLLACTETGRQGLSQALAGTISSLPA